jgi:aryl-alcohol dehydrogenase-like predicted oxidoreductase
MRKVELVPGVESSVLGFGCAPILGAVGGRTAGQALACALDCGVNHFDIARSYGYGEAEAYLGRFLAGRRDEVVIASKFGIRATWKAGLLRPLKPLVRALRDLRKPGDARSAPIAATSAAPRADPFHERVPLTAAAMRHSLERSLKALRTDYLDLFFVHEPVGSLSRVDELAAAAESLKTEGKIRGWGLAFDWRNHGELAGDFGRFDVLQFNNSPGAEHYDAVRRELADRPNLFFSPFRASGGMDPGEVLTRLWSDFPRSVVLCSMFTPKHIRANAALAGS